MADTKIRTYVHRLTNTMAKAFQLNSITVDRSTLDQCPALAVVYLRKGQVVGTVNQKVNGLEHRFQIYAGEWLICNLPTPSVPFDESLPVVWYSLNDEEFKKNFVELKITS